MIIIFGSTHDDILYYESVMNNKKEEKLYDIYPLTYGKIFNQEVVLVHDVYTSYISALITSYIISKYFVVLIFVVGKCIAYSNDVKSGEIAISKRVILGDVDQIRGANVKLGQIPHLPRSLETGEEVIGYLTDAIERRSFSRYSISTFVSANKIFDQKERISDLIMDDYVLGHKTNVVFDCTSGGVFLSAHLHKIPCIAIKVCERMIDGKVSMDDYINVLKQYSNVGRAVVTCIGDIGRNDIIKA